MARIVGNLVPEDDYMHVLGPESNWNESMYFNFFDREHRLGGFVRLGNRANERQAEMTVALYLPDGRALFMWKRPEITSNDAFDAGGLRFEVLEPAKVIGLIFNGYDHVLSGRYNRHYSGYYGGLGAHAKRPGALGTISKKVGALLRRGDRPATRSRRARDRSR